jgi:D-3-phosphoglycerate dehydrogenase
LHENIVWVQLDAAGIEPWFESGLIDGKRVWTCAKGQYGVAVAEHVVMLVLAALRRLKELLDAKQWAPLRGELLAGKTVGLAGAGGIGRELISRLRPFGVRIIALSEPGGFIEGADESLGPDGLEVLLAKSDVVVLAVPVTPKTKGFIGRDQLNLIGPSGWLVNVSRGALVQTDALVAALTEGRLGGACVDVTDPEPLEDGHPLWDMPNVIITPHTATSVDLAGADSRLAEYACLVRDNVRRFVVGEALLAMVDPDLGY